MTDRNSAPDWARQPSVAVMILNFNGLRWLRRCLPSIVKSSYQNLNVYVVDNGSTDGSLEFVKSSYPDIKLVPFSENLGFAEAYNRAIKRVRADYVLLLNNDTAVLDRDWIEVLVHRAEENPSVGAVACKLVSMEDHRRLDSAGVMGIKYWRGFVEIGKYEMDRGQYDHPPIAPFSASGAAMLIRRIAFEQMGGLDCKFFAYVEDVDLCWRLRLAGYDIAYQPSARVAHYFSATTGHSGLAAGKLYLTHRNVLRCIIKNCGSSLRWALRNYFLFSLMIAAGFCVFEPRKANATIRAVLWNLLNLRDSYAWRLKVQTSRRKGEEEILDRMYPSLGRYRPAEHSELRHLLDILFEYSQLSKMHNRTW